MPRILSLASNQRLCTRSTVKAALDEWIDHLLPDLADAHGLVQYAGQSDEWTSVLPDARPTAFNANPFALFTYQRRVVWAFDQEKRFAPQNDLRATRTSLMTLGRSLSTVGETPVNLLLRKNVLGQVGLAHDNSQDCHRRSMHSQPHWAARQNRAELVRDTIQELKSKRFGIRQDAESRNIDSSTRSFPRPLDRHPGDESHIF
jgi:hypothetical protein